MRVLLEIRAGRKKSRAQKEISISFAIRPERIPAGQDNSKEFQRGERIDGLLGVANRQSPLRSQRPHDVSLGFCPKTLYPRVSMTELSDGPEFYLLPAVPRETHLCA